MLLINTDQSKTAHNSSVMKVPKYLPDLCLLLCSIEFFGVFRFRFYWSVWVYLLWVGWEIYVYYCVLCIFDHVLMFKFEFVFFVFGSGFALYVLVLLKLIVFLCM